VTWPEFMSAAVSASTLGVLVSKRRARLHAALSQVLPPKVFITDSLLQNAAQLAQHLALPPPQQQQQQQQQVSSEYVSLAIIQHELLPLLSTLNSKLGNNAAWIIYKPDDASSVRDAKALQKTLSRPQQSSSQQQQQQQQISSQQQQQSSGLMTPNRRAASVVQSQYQHVTYQLPQLVMLSSLCLEIVSSGINVLKEHQS
jgi:hypothetical protein